MKFSTLPFLLAAFALTTACGDDDDTTSPEGEARVRVIHIAPDVPEVDLLLDGNVIEEDIPYGTVTPYEEAAAGNRSVQVRPTGTTTAIIEGDVVLTDDVSHTLLVGGTLASPEFEALEDDLSAPDGGSAKLRLIHGAPGAGQVDVYLTEPGADLANESPDLAAIEFGEVLDYTQIEEGDYQVRVTPTGFLTPFIDEALSLGSGDIRTAIAIEAQGGGAPYRVLLTDDTN